MHNTIYRLMNKFIYLLISIYSLLTLTTAAAQTLSPYPPKVETAIAQSPIDRKEWTKLLEEYRKKNQEKYNAACFLIANAPLHHQAYVIEKVDNSMTDWLKRGEQQYYALVRYRNDTALFNPYFNENILAKADQAYRKATEAKRFNTPQVRFDDFSDAALLSPTFVRQQVEHAFAVRERSRFARKLSFQDFLHYILPYRALENTAAELATTYADVYEKYLHADTAQNIRNVIWRYNLTAKRLRYWGGTYPFELPGGAYEMGFLDSENCANKVDRAVQILRSCGIPAAVEYNIAYKIWEGRHFHVAVPTEKGWETFNPEESLPEYRNKGFKAALNVYRIQFAEQPTAPFALRNEGEPIPEALSSPFIEDVTSNMARTFQVTIPFSEDTSHRLAYLATFRESDYGLLPVTWGIINKKEHNVVFQNVVPDHLYFPIYLDEEGETLSFSNPFYIKTGDSKLGFVLQVFEPQKKQAIKALLERTYPRKSEMLEAAKRAVGTYVIASDDEKFTKADTIGRVVKQPTTDWEDLSLTTKRPYRYYRVCGSPQNPQVYLGEIAFLSDIDTTRYMTDAPYNTSLSPEENAKWKQLWDEPVEKSTWKAEYDGRPNTAPDSWPDVTLRLQSPKVVNCLRYMGKHASNTIEKGQTYELLAWHNGYWKKIVSIIGETNLLQVPDLYEGQLYWLRNKDKKQECMPFLINKTGQQIFPQIRQ